MYAGPEGIWTSKPDGTSLTKLTDLGTSGIDLRRLRSPMGDRIALTVQTEEGFDLVEVLIPGGETKTIAHLYSITEEELVAEPTSERAFTAYAIRDYDNLAWQPGGRYLAFVGAMDGPTADLYLYDTESDEIKRLTDGDEVQAVFPTWSWDGEFILLYGVSWRGPFGGAILGHDHLDEVVSIQVSTGKGFLLPVPKSVAFNFGGWQDERHFITYDSDETCGSRNLRSVDLLTGEVTPLMDASFTFGTAILYGPFLFTSAACPNSLGEGTFLLPHGETTPIKLLDKQVAELSWVTDSNAFYAYPEGFFSADGTKLYEPPVYGKSYHPAISYNGYQAWEVIENRQGRVVIKVPGGDWQTVLEGDVAGLAWNVLSSPTLTIVLKDGSLYTASAPGFTPQLMGTVEGVNQIWVPLP
jgi:dipeptidyl aminopeptidase/acylaminoacyl peptidase